MVYFWLNFSELISRSLAFMLSSKSEMGIADRGARTVVAAGTDPFSQHYMIKMIG